MLPIFLPHYVSGDLAVSWLGYHSLIYPTTLGSVGVTYFRTQRMLSIADGRQNGHSTVPPGNPSAQGRH